ncbi:MAG: hypothetical protein GY858_08885 [Candidatus Omnitrophica bacterium]|nr:hypothetical protein [Candidatus Omnitrophota bacterium]
MKYMILKKGGNVVLFYRTKDPLWAFEVCGGKRYFMKDKMALLTLNAFYHNGFERVSPEGAC